VKSIIPGEENKNLKVTRVEVWVLNKRD